MLFLIDFDAGISLVNNCRRELGPLSLRNEKINAQNCSDHLKKH